MPSAAACKVRFSIIVEGWFGSRTQKSGRHQNHSRAESQRVDCDAPGDGTVHRQQSATLLQFYEI